MNLGKVVSNQAQQGWCFSNQQIIATIELPLDIYMVSRIPLCIQHTTHGTLVAELRPGGERLSFHDRRRAAGRRAADRHRVLSCSDSLRGVARAGHCARGGAVGLSHAAAGRRGHDCLRRGLRVVPDRLDHSEPDFSLPTDGQQGFVHRAAQQPGRARARPAHSSHPDRLFIGRVF